MALALKGTLNRKVLHALSKNVLNKKYTRQFSLLLLLLFLLFFSSLFFLVSLWSSLLKNQHSKTWPWALRFCSLLDIRRKASICDRSVCYIMSWPFFLFFIRKEWTNMATPQEAPMWSDNKTKNKYFCCISIYSTTIMKSANGNVATFATFVGQLSRFPGAPFKIGSSVLFQWLWWTMSPDKAVSVIVVDSVAR